MGFHVDLYRVKFKRDINNLASMAGMLSFLFRKISLDRNNRLGEGGCGSVFHGKFNGIKVAVKRVELLKVVENEELALKQLDHPNIIKLLHSESGPDFK